MTDNIEPRGLLKLTAEQLGEIRRWCEGGCYGHTSQTTKLLAELDAQLNGPFDVLLGAESRWQVTGPGYWRSCENEEEAEDVAGLLNIGWRAGRRSM